MKRIRKKRGEEESKPNVTLIKNTYFSGWRRERMRKGERERKSNLNKRLTPADSFSLPSRSTVKKFCEKLFCRLVNVPLGFLYSNRPSLYSSRRSLLYNNDVIACLSSHWFLMPFDLTYSLSLALHLIGSVYNVIIFMASVMVSNIKIKIDTNSNT